jgi:hypothetical protein
MIVGDQKLMNLFENPDRHDDMFVIENKDAMELLGQDSYFLCGRPKGQGIYVSQVEPLVWFYDKCGE